MLSYDVVVVGGGVSGSMAAISAARQGSKVLLIEKNGYMGGTLTENGVGPMMTFFAGEKQVVKGIMEEVVQRLVEKGMSAGHVRDATNYISYLTPFSAEGLKLVLDEMSSECGIDILYHTFLAGVTVSESSVKSITICNKAGLSKVTANVFIDATGDADLSYFAGVPTTKGRESDGAMQPLTLKMKYMNVDGQALRKYILDAPADEFPRHYKDIDNFKSAKRLSVVGFDKLFASARKQGKISIQREDVLLFETDTEGEFIINTTRVIGKDPTNPFALSQAETIGRKQAHELDAFLRENVPGFKHAHLEFTGPSIGVRSSRQIVGCHIITVDDLVNGRKFHDVIAHGGYPIDIHNPTGVGTETRYFTDGHYYSIPYRALITEKLDNLIVTGRCISSTFEAQAAFRVTPIVGAIGQAAGTAAALATGRACNVRNIDTGELQAILIKNDAYIEREINNE